ncbi:MAG: trimeric intracellular cation channel family protein [Abditibacteriota bacterium]|nr:trimeric intracellular cation channel family protein [Abditibacteriota bacterium]
MSSDLIFEILNLIAIAIFAFTGFIVAAKKNMDIFGIIVIGEITALAGGTFRDILIPRTIVWIEHVEFLAPAIIAGIVFFYLNKKFNFNRRALLYLDALGVALFSIDGSKIALMFYTNPVIIISLGLITGIVGGIVRDVLCNQVPVIFQKDLYATCIILGCSLFVILNYFHVNPNLNYGISIFTIIIIRFWAIKKKISLPGYNDFINN